MQRKIYVRAYNRGSMIFNSKVLARASSWFEKPVFSAYLPIAGGEFGRICQNLIFIRQDLSFEPKTKSMTFRSNVIIRTRKRWQTDRQTDTPMSSFLEAPNYRCLRVTSKQWQTDGPSLKIKARAGPIRVEMIYSRAWTFSNTWWRLMKCMSIIVLMLSEDAITHWAILLQQF